MDDPEKHAAIEDDTHEKKNRCNTSCCKRCWKWCCVVFMGVLVILVLTFAGFAATSEMASNFQVYDLLPNDRVWNIAHAGGHNLWPDNTIFAFKNAIAIGADVLECDIRLTKDGEIVIIHDERTGHYTESNEKVQDLTLAEIQALDAGYSFGSLYSQKTPFDSAERSDPAQTFPFRNLGIKIPTLEEMLTEFPDVPKMIEVKPIEEDQEEPFVQKELIISLCNILKTYNQTDKVMIASFVQEAIDEFRAVCPEVSVVPSYGPIIRLWLASMFGMEKAVTPQYETIAIPTDISLGPISLEITKERFIKATHSRNVKVTVWTINEAEGMKELMSKNIDGIITDRLDLLQNLNGNLDESSIVTLTKMQATLTGTGCLNNQTLLSLAGCTYLGF